SCPYGRGGQKSHNRARRRQSAGASRGTPAPAERPDHGHSAGASRGTPAPATPVMHLIRWPPHFQLAVKVPNWLPCPPVSPTVPAPLIDPSLTVPMSPPFRNRLSWLPTTSK